MRGSSAARGDTFINSVISYEALIVSMSPGFKHVIKELHCEHNRMMLSRCFNKKLLGQNTYHIHIHNLKFK